MVAPARTRIFFALVSGNVDITAVTAPRPLGITTADDWTVEFKTKGHPDLIHLYDALERAEVYEAHFDTHFKHNYNHVSRTHLYGFLNRHFGLGLEEPVLERDFEFLTGAGLSVWNEEHPRPSGSEVGVAHERKLCRWMTADTDRQMHALLNPANQATATEAREVIGGAVEVMIGRSIPQGGDFEHELVEKSESDGYVEMSGIVRDHEAGDEIPVVSLYPANWTKRVAVWLHPDGKDSVYGTDGLPRLEVVRLLEGGCAVMGVDLMGQGDHHPAGANDWGARNRDVGEGKEIKAGQEWLRSALYSYGYNHSLFCAAGTRCDDGLCFHRRKSEVGFRGACRSRC